MSHTNPTISVQSIEKLLAQVIDLDSDFDAREVSPDGDCYNDLHQMVVLGLTLMIDAAQGKIPVPETAVSATPPQQPQLAQSRQPVGEVLRAIISRLPLATARQVMSGYEKCWQEQLNGNAGSQNRVDREFDAVTQQAAANMLASDRQYLETLLAPPAGSTV